MKQEQTRTGESREAEVFQFVAHPARPAAPHSVRAWHCACMYPAHISHLPRHAGARIPYG
jgi:hypothetical protein